jgi:hypothetical protein
MKLQDNGLRGGLIQATEIPQVPQSYNCDQNRRRIHFSVPPHGLRKIPDSAKSNCEDDLDVLDAKQLEGIHS